MRKIHMTRNFFEAIVTLGPFFRKKQKTRFQIWSRGVFVRNFRSVSFGHEALEKQIEIRSILYRLLASFGF